MSENKYWVCIIEVDGSDDVPYGGDFPPRCAAETAMEKMGLNVISNASGWGTRKKTVDAIHALQYAQFCEDPEELK